MPKHPSSEQDYKRYIMGQNSAYKSLLAGIFAITLLSVTIASTNEAAAKCKKFGYSVNDYGKEWPTRDAKNLLDKYIATWMKKNGIESYTTKPKTVECKLFLDVFIFDEYTCRADTTACW